MTVVGCNHGYKPLSDLSESDLCESCARQHEHHQEFVDRRENGWQMSHPKKQGTLGVRKALVPLISWLQLLWTKHAACAVSIIVNPSWDTRASVGKGSGRTISYLARKMTLRARASCKLQWTSPLNSLYWFGVWCV